MSAAARGELKDHTEQGASPQTIQRRNLGGIHSLSTTDGYALRTSFSPRQPLGSLAARPARPPPKDGNRCMQSSADRGAAHNNERSQKWPPPTSIVSS